MLDANMMDLLKVVVLDVLRRAATLVGVFFVVLMVGPFLLDTAGKLVQSIPHMKYHKGKLFSV